MYELKVVLSGPSAVEYETSYVRGKSVMILPVGSPPPTPILLSVRFSDDGSSLLFQWDSSTDRVQIAYPLFACSDVVEFPAAISSKCFWKSDSQLIAYPYSDTSTLTLPIIGDEVVVKGGILRARCYDLSSVFLEGPPCPEWDTSDETSSKILPPLQGVKPTIFISAPKTIASCASLTLDISSSLGHGGRKWQSTFFEVSSIGGTSQEDETTDAALAEWLNNFYSSDPPVAIPTLLLLPGRQYNIMMRMCNFLNICGEASHRVQILQNIRPLVNIFGSLTRSMKRDEELKLSSTASITLCKEVGNTTLPWSTKAGLLYSWSFSAGGELIPELQSVSKTLLSYFCPLIPWNKTCHMKSLSPCFRNIFCPPLQLQ
jgi:hypothetical protein